MQIDLIDVTNRIQKNKCIKSILTIICSFTKRALIFTIKNKNSDAVLKAPKSFINKIDKFPSSILINAGTKFTLARQ